MRKMKRLVSVVLAGAVAFTLVACSGSSPKSSGQESSATAQGTKTEEANASKAEEEGPKDTEAKASEDGPIIIGFLGWSSGADAMYG